MKLFVSTTSPYARLVMVTAYLNNIDLTLKFVLPWGNPKELLVVNPFCQVPALITETSVILAYLLPKRLPMKKLPQCSV